MSFDIDWDNPETINPQTGISIKYTGYWDKKKGAWIIVWHRRYVQ